MEEKLTEKFHRLTNILFLILNNTTEGWYSADGIQLDTYVTDSVINGGIVKSLTNNMITIVSVVSFDFVEAMEGVFKSH